MAQVLPPLAQGPAFSPDGELGQAQRPWHHRWPAAGAVWGGWGAKWKERVWGPWSELLLAPQDGGLGAPQHHGPARMDGLGNWEAAAGSGHPAGPISWSHTVSAVSGSVLWGHQHFWFRVPLSHQPPPPSTLWPRCGGCLAPSPGGRAGPACLTPGGAYRCGRGLSARTLGFRGFLMRNSQ